MDQQDLFEFESEDYSLYSSSVESLPDLDEISTPLLYETKINSSRTNSITSPIILDHLDFDESFIELDLNNEILNKSILQNKLSISSFQLPKTISNSLTSPSLQNNHDDINSIIQQGSSHLKNNYKLWLNKKVSA